MNKGFKSEIVARERAAADMPNKVVYIIESRGEFYVETVDESYGGFIRSWEREVYHGLGRKAVLTPDQKDGGARYEARQNTGIDY